MPEQDLYAPNPGNGSKCYRPDRFRFTTIGSGILTGGKSITGMLIKVLELWDYTRTSS